MRRYERTTTITVAGFNDLGYRRGDYIEIGTVTAPTVPKRVVEIVGCCMTVRGRSRWRVMEWLRVRAEDWFMWPVADLWARIKSAETDR